MKYFDAFDLQERMNEIVLTLGMEHIDLERVSCIRSKGSSTRNTLARCHALGKVMQHGMKTGAHYTIEFLELFDKLNRKEQDKVIIHELMHIPKSFGGGFRHHDFVCDRNVEIMHENFEIARQSRGHSTFKKKEKVEGFENLKRKNSYFK